VSYCEDYIDPFPRQCDHGVPDGIRCGECAAEMEDDERWECAYPGECLMPSMGHHRSECYTVEDVEG
jgi:hypothetical protein